MVFHRHLLKMLPIGLAALLSGSVLAGPALAADVAADPHDIKPGSGTTLFELPPSRFAKTFDQGLAAYDRGDFEEAYALWLPIAKQGDLAAMRNVGMMLREGQGVDRDVETAARWYLAAAKRGLTSAQINLAELYYYGDGVPQSYDMAGQWYARAAQAGNAMAQFKLADMIVAGHTETRDLELAKQLYGWAALAGHSGALDRLRELDARQEPISHSHLFANRKPDEGEDAFTLPKTLEGPGDPPYTEDMPYTEDVKRRLRRAETTFLSGGRGDAVRQWRILALDHVPEAQYRLGLALLQGDGVPENRPEALHWLDIAATGGHKRAGDLLTTLGS